jgi:sec-independent protein translocase protein TatA
MDFPGGWELIVVLVVVVVLFGSKKLPDAARSLGRSMRIFKAETKGLRSDETPAIEPSQTEVTQTPAEPPVATPPAGSDSR